MRRTSSFLRNPEGKRPLGKLWFKRENAKLGLEK
jgi:hypothetical protein